MQGQILEELHGEFRVCPGDRSSSQCIISPYARPIVADGKDSQRAQGNLRAVVQTSEALVCSGLACQPRT